MKIKKLSSVALLSSCIFSLSACNELDFSGVPGYKTLFADKQDVSKVKRRPIENVVTATAPQIIDPRVAIERRIANQNMYAAPNSVKQNFDDPQLFGNTKVVRPDYGNRELNNSVGKPEPDFRTNFAPINPIRTEERSAYSGRFVNQTPQYPGQNNPGQYWPETNDPSAPNVSNPKLPNYAYNTVLVAGQYGNQPQQLANAPQAIAPQIDPNQPRAPSLNNRARMELLAGTTTFGATTVESYPNLSSVPPKRDYNELKTEMNGRMEQLMQERLHAAELQKQVNNEQPIELIGPAPTTNEYTVQINNQPLRQTAPVQPQQQSTMPIIERVPQTPESMRQIPQQGSVIQSPLNNYEIGQPQPIQNVPVTPVPAPQLSRTEVDRIAEQQFTSSAIQAAQPTQPQYEMSTTIQPNQPLRDSGEMQEFAASENSMSGNNGGETVLPLPIEQETKSQPIEPQAVLPPPAVEAASIKLRKPSQPPVYLERARQTPESFQYRSIEPQVSAPEALPPASMQQPRPIPVPPPVTRNDEPMSFQYRQFEPAQNVERNVQPEQPIKLRPPEPLSLRSEYKENEVIPPMSIERPEFVDAPPVVAAPETIKLRPPVIDSPEMPATRPATRLVEPQNSGEVRTLPQSRYSRRK